MSENYGITRFYTCLARMQREYDKYARQDGMNAVTREEFLGWKEKTKAMLIRLLGLDRMEMCNIKPIVAEKVRLDGGITREKVIIQTEEDVWMPMYILIPDECAGNSNAKCYIAMCGHQGGGKYSIAGCADIPQVKEAIDRFNYDYGLALAKQGCVAICPDCRGFGERRDMAKQGDEFFLEGTCYNLAHMAEPLGMTVAGMNTWDGFRLIDYIEERGEWDTDDIACVGFSGGGMQAMWLGALDERVKKVIISGYMYGFRDAHLYLNNNCSCNYVPHLWEHVDMGDIAAMIAPRRLIIQSGLDDHLNGPGGIDNVNKQVDIIKKAYSLFDAGDNMRHDVFPGGHMWHNEHLSEYISM